MNIVERRVAELKMEGLCCSQIVTKIVGLEAQNKENNDIVKAMRGLCYGMYTQYACGSLVGGVCALSLYDFDGEELEEACQDLVAWFIEHFGGANCSDLLGPGGRPTTICRDSIVQTSAKCLEILEDYSLINNNMFA
ncbi:MAG: C-GCAxxG-C-C family protein [Bacillota bacterium]|jgi:hypothetical protein